jgi:nicotinate (nicotinamide) nucleotide adenylyltransferase
MNQLLIFLDHQTLKAREVESWERLEHPLKWMDLEFELTTSSQRMVTWPNLLPDLPPETARSFLDLLASRYPFSRDREKLQELCPQLIFEFPGDEWVFFGGSFYPWHQGHQACLDLLPQDKLCFILPDKNPLKEDLQREPVVTSLELIRKIKFGPHHYFVPTFLIHEEKNPTVNWIQNLHTKFPHKKLSLLMGFDSFKGITKWIQAKELLSMLTTIYVASRMEKDEEHQKMMKKIHAQAPDLKVVFLGRHSFEHVSSTRLRNLKTRT